MNLLVNVLSITLVLDPNRGPALRYACDELTAFCRESPKIEVREAGEPPKDDPGLVVLVGKGPAFRHAMGVFKDVNLEELGREGYVLRSFTRPTGPVVIAVGGTEAGTRNAVYELMRRLDVSASPPRLESNLRILERPSFDWRGMYAHQHWAYNYPYALRTWSVEEWKKYVDILALMRVNLFQIWSMAGILPVPLSADDEAFLKRYPPVIEHARRNHGMEVWIGECANNVCDKRDVPPVAQRDYFAVETLKNPGDPKQMAELKAARAEFYRVCSNADGYWVIDSDPGGWKGSPPSEFVDILMMNRDLMDRHTRLGREAKLVYWMWFGWTDRADKAGTWRATLKDLMRRSPEPWLLTAADKNHWKVVDELGLAGRTVYYPYGAVEHEPSLPFTMVVPEELTDALNVPERVGHIRGAMGNAQTPMVQLPNIYYFTRAAWNMNLRAADRETAMKELARLIYPEKVKLLAESWMSLGNPEAPKARQLADELEKLSGTRALGRPGPIGIKLFPDYGQVARDLAQQLRIHAVAVDTRRLALDASAGEDKVLQSLTDYCLLSLAWRRQNGFKNYGTNGYDFFPLREAVHKRWWRGDHLDKQVYAHLESAMRKAYDSWEAELVLYPLNH